jgi:hypothetical protein
MPTMTLAQAEAALAAWIAADRAVAQGQSYTIDGRSMTLANADTISKKIQFYERQISRLTHKGIKVRGIIPLHES